MKTALFVVLAFLLMPCHVIGQNLNPIKKQYTGYMDNALERHKLFTLYYIIKKDKKKIKGHLFNTFVFSSDSNTVTGYIRYDSSARNMMFVSVNYKSPHVNCKAFGVEQKLFSFKDDSTTVCSIDRLGGQITIISKQVHGKIEMHVFPEYYPSDQNYVTGLVFNARFFPDEIIMADVFAKKSVSLRVDTF